MKNLLFLILSFLCHVALAQTTTFTSNTNGAVLSIQHNPTAGTIVTGGEISIGGHVFGGTNQSAIRIGTAWAPDTNTRGYNGITMNQSYTDSVGTNRTLFMMNIRPFYNFMAGSKSIYGNFYWPVESSMVGIEHYGFVSASPTARSGFGLLFPLSFLHVGYSSNITPFTIDPGPLPPGVPIDGSFQNDGANMNLTINGQRGKILNAQSVNTVSPTNPNITIKINIDGVDYYLHAKTTND